MAKHPTHPYLNEVAPYPLDSNDWSVPAVLRNLVASGLVQYSRLEDLLPPTDLEVGSDEWRAAYDRFLLCFYRFTGDYNLYLAITELAKHSEEGAAKVVNQILSSYDGGDAYGEWLWQWAGELGLDQQRLIAEEKACLVCSAHVGREVEAS